MLASGAARRADRLCCAGSQQLACNGWSLGGAGCAPAWRLCPWELHWPARRPESSPPPPARAPPASEGPPPSGSAPPVAGASPNPERSRPSVLRFGHRILGSMAAKVSSKAWASSRAESPVASQLSVRSGRCRPVRRCHWWAAVGLNCGVRGRCGPPRRSAGCLASTPDAALKDSPASSQARFQTLALDDRHAGWNFRVEEFSVRGPNAAVQLGCRS